MFAAVDWLYSKIPVRFPDLKICLSEGGLGWVAGPARPARPRGPLPVDLRHVGGHRAHAPRGHAAELLVLRDRRPGRSRAAPPDRHRPRAARDRLPAPGRHLARHPRAAPPPDRPLPGRRHPQAHVGERVASCSTTRCPSPPRPTPTRTDPRRRSTRSVDVTDIRFRIAAARRILYRQGCDSNIGGHVERAGARRGRLLGDRARVLRPDDARPGGASSASTSQARVGEMAFSPAVNFHAAIYQRRPDVEAIVHLHSHHVSVLLVDRSDDRHVQRRLRALPRGPGDLRRRRRAAPPRRGRRPRRQAGGADEEPRRDRRVAVARARHHRGGDARGGGPLPPRVRGDRRHRDRRGRGRRRPGRLPEVLPAEHVGGEPRRGCAARIPTSSSGIDG